MIVLAAIVLGLVGVATVLVWLPRLRRRREIILSRVPGDRK